MYLRVHKRNKDGKEIRYWSVVENHRIGKKRVVQRTALYLGEINDSQKEAWWRAIEVLERGHEKPRSVALFPDDRAIQSKEHEVVNVYVNRMRLERPRQWGACWLALELWEQLQLDRYWADRLHPSREGTNWLNILKTLVCSRLIKPGSEWKLHREWYGNSAMGDLLGEDGDAISYQNLYRCLDKLVEHKDGMFVFLKGRWQDMFNAGFDVLLYDLTSTYFECDVPEDGKRKFGYSRDKRSDCVQVVIALIVTPEGFPLCFEVLDGNTSDRTTLRHFLKKIEAQYGKANRVWVMDRGIPTEEVLEEMRNPEASVHYLVGTPKARLNVLEAQLLSLPWEEVRDELRVKLLKQGDELYVLACSTPRQSKERAMRRRRLKKYWNRLKDLQKMKLTRDQLLMKVGAAKTEAGGVARLVDISLPSARQKVTPETFHFSINRENLKTARRHEGQYLLRSNLDCDDPSKLWKYYMQLVEVEQAFKTLKSDMSLRPIYHQKDERIEAHIFVAFLSYCLQITLQQQLKALAPGLTARSAIEKFEAVQMVDVFLPTTTGKELRLPRYTEPSKELALLLMNLDIKLPQQPKPVLLDRRKTQEAELVL
ncbi:MAG: IS1634 family transposase [Holophagaceae bacterium]|nr:IS1634 family transposase [Holophagaceae bacterium]